MGWVDSLMGNKNPHLELYPSHNKIKGDSKLNFNFCAIIFPTKTVIKIATKLIPLSPSLMVDIETQTSLVEASVAFIRSALLS